MKYGTFTKWKKLKNSLVKLTSFNLIFKSVLAIHQDLVKILGFVRQRHIHDVHKLIWVMEIQDFMTPIVGFTNVIHQNVKNFLEKVLSVSFGLLSVQNRKEIWNRISMEVIYSLGWIKSLKLSRVIRTLIRRINLNCFSN